MLLLHIEPCKFCKDVQNSRHKDIGPRRDVTKVTVWDLLFMKLIVLQRF